MEFVSNLENGVYSEILQGGRIFQVAKATPDHCRALVKQAPILILDDSMSALTMQQTFL